MQSAARQYSRGMTLMELMIVVVIVSILASIAVPSYIQQVRKSRRVEAKTALLDLAGREERYFSTSVTGANYSDIPSDVGYTGAAWPLQVGSNYYTVTVCVAKAVGATPACDPNPNPPTAPSFYILATPVAGTTQANDQQCTSFGVDSIGAQFATGNQTAAFCWSN
jgi:type IV pilus assembly protein PilE